MRANSRGKAGTRDRVSTDSPTDSWENEGGSFIALAKGEAGGVPETAVQVRPAVAMSPRSYLLHALARVLDGAELSRGELEAAITGSGNLTQHENDAWQQLGHWVDETEVRAKDKNYAAFHIDWLRDLQSKLEQ
jgi:hypothetical protein